MEHFDCNKLKRSAWLIHYLFRFGGYFNFRAVKVSLIEPVDIVAFYQGAHFVCDGKQERTKRCECKRKRQGEENRTKVASLDLLRASAS